MPQSAKTEPGTFGELDFNTNGFLKHMQHSWFTVLFCPTKISFKMYSHVKIHLHDCESWSMLCFWLLTTAPDDDFIFYMIFVSSGGALHSRREWEYQTDLSTIKTFKFNIEKQVQPVWIAFPTVLCLATRRHCSERKYKLQQRPQRLTPLQPFLNLHSVTTATKVEAQWADLIGPSLWSRQEVCACVCVCSCTLISANTSRPVRARRPK